MFILSERTKSDIINTLMPQVFKITPIDSGPVSAFPKTVDIIDLYNTKLYAAQDSCNKIINRNPKPSNSYIIDLLPKNIQFFQQTKDNEKKILLNCKATLEDLKKRGYFGRTKEDQNNYKNLKALIPQLENTIKFQKNECKKIKAIALNKLGVVSEKTLYNIVKNIIDILIVSRLAIANIIKKQENCKNFLSRAVSSYSSQINKIYFTLNDSKNKSQLGFWFNKLDKALKDNFALQQSYEEFGKKFDSKVVKYTGQFLPSIKNTITKMQNSVSTSYLYDIEKTFTNFQTNIVGFLENNYFPQSENSKQRDVDKDNLLQAANIYFYRTVMEECDIVKELDLTIRATKKELISDSVRDSMFYSFVLLIFAPIAIGMLVSDNIKEYRKISNLLSDCLSPNYESLNKRYISDILEQAESEYKEIQKTISIAKMLLKTNQEDLALIQANPLMDKDTSAKLEQHYKQIIEILTLTVSGYRKSLKTAEDQIKKLKT